MASRLTSGTVAAVALISSHAYTTYPDCADGLECKTLTPSDKPTLTFDCAFGSPKTDTNMRPTKGLVYLMHGNDDQVHACTPTIQADPPTKANPLAVQLHHTNAV